MAQTLNLRGNEKVLTSGLWHMCNHNNCWKSIKPGEKYIQDNGKTYTIRIECADKMCNDNGVEARYL